MRGTLQTAGVLRRRPPLRYLLRLAVTSISIVGCLSRAQPPTPGSPINATAIPAASPTALSLATPRPRPTTGPCVNDATFVTDITIPDGTPVEPGASLDKIWRVQNNGTCDWRAGYALVRLAGPAMGSDETSGLFPARAGAEVDVRLALTAPSEPGEYTTTWQMRDADGQLFGDVLFMTVQVVETR